MTYLSRIFLLICFVCTSVLVQAQKGYELGGWVGTSYYFGDLNSTFRITKPSLALGFLARYNFDDRVSLKTSLNYGKVGADDANSSNNWERNRNLSFSSTIFDWSNVVEFNFFKYQHGSKAFKMTPFFYGGFNVFKFNPTAILNGKKYDLRELGTEGQAPGQEYGSISAGMVLGGGFKWDISRDYSLNIDISTRFLFTDFLDDVSTVFPDKTALAAAHGDIAVQLSDRSLIDGLGDAGRQRGDTKGKDKYTFAGISIVKYFGGIECPEISKPKY